MASELSPIIAVVLVGGLGTRLQALLPNVPKPMATVAGKPFLGWILTYLQRQGIPQALLSTGYLAEVIERYAQPQPIAGLNLRCYAEPSPLGTAGGFVNAVEQSQAQPLAWLVLNGDSLIVTELEPMFKALGDDQVDGVILGVEVPEADRYGSLVYDEQGTLLDFGEKQAGSGVINAGVYLFRDRLLKQFPQKMPLSFEYDVFPELLRQSACIKVHAVQAPFLDIGTPASLSQAEAFVQQYFQPF